MPRDYSRDWVKASPNRSGALVHLPRELLEMVGLEADEPIQVKRYPGSEDRSRVILNLRNEPSDS